ncbi:DUF1203 domain-containing protein [Mucilaginibacter sp.]|uniref:DUF1203 domain-containing protein n=1 Tax=Mucilaginibacter sp. TaxID=1882438 RepID=UPI0035BC5D5C
MKNFKIIPLSKAYVNSLKAAMADDFGNTITEHIATGKGPCRLTLRPFNIGVDSRLLLKHSPFAIGNAFDQPGPIFVNSSDVEEYSDIYRFPPEIETDKVGFPLSLIGYDDEQMMIFTQLVGNDDVDELIARIFANDQRIAYLHARNAEACCYICKIERLT